MAAEERLPTVLIADLDNTVRQTASSALETSGYRCVPAESAAHAQQLLRRHDFDLALVGADFDEAGTPPLAETLRGDGPESPDFTPVVLLLRHEQLEERLQSIGEQCDDFLVVPLSEVELRARVTALEQARRRSSALARTADQLRELQQKKRDLAALVVHDLRNPLAAIRGNLELLNLELGPVEGEVESILGDLVELAEKSLSMAAGLLDVEELEEGILEARTARVEVEPIARGISRHQRAAIQARDLEAVFDIEADLTGVFDATLISRILENLLDNAVRYAPRGGRVVVSVSREGEELVFAVGNNGPPVPEAQRERLFDRYFRLEARRENARSGRGLGLYFCKLAAQAHGGSISVVELPELPACFQLRIPQPAAE